MASRGHAGGLAASSVAAATVLDAAGFDLILLETVGTGQSEVEVAAAADTTVVLEAPEMGDEVQAIKAGLLEVADIVVVNKGDRPGAQRTAAELRAMLTVGASPRAGGRRPRRCRRRRRRGAGTVRPQPKRPEVLVTTATTGDGIAELLAAISPAPPGAAARRRPAIPVRRARAAALVWALVGDRVRGRLLAPDLAAAPRPRSTRSSAMTWTPTPPRMRLLAALVAEHGAEPRSRG